MAEMDLDDILASEAQWCLAPRAHRALAGALDDMDSDSSDEEPGEPITAPMVATQPEAPSLPNTAGPGAPGAPQPAAENPEDAMKEIMVHPTSVAAVPLLSPFSPCCCLSAFLSAWLMLVC